MWQEPPTLEGAVYHLPKGKIWPGMTIEYTCYDNLYSTTGAASTNATALADGWEVFDPEFRCVPGGCSGPCCRWVHEAKESRLVHEGIIVTKAGRSAIRLTLCSFSKGNFETCVHWGLLSGRPANVLIPFYPQRATTCRKWNTLT